MEKSNIPHFKAEDIKNVMVYHFNVSTNAKAMAVAEREDIERIMEAFSEIKIERDAKPEDETCGGDVTSFRFRLEDGKEYVITYWEGILRNPDGINYKVSAKSLEGLWDDLDYEKNSVSQGDLPVINKQ